MVGQQFTPEQRILMVLSYHENGSPSQTSQAFAERFPNRRPPDKNTILRNFKKHKSKESCNKPQPKQGYLDRPRVSRWAMTAMRNRTEKCLELQGGDDKGRN